MALITVPTATYARADNACENGNGLTSFTANPDAQNATEGVSLKNALTSPTTDDDNVQQQAFTPTIDDILSPDFIQPEGYQWYFMRVNYNRAEKLYNELKNKREGYLIWMPCQKTIKYQDGKKIESLVPIFKSNLFIYATYDMAYSLTRRAVETGYPYVDFAYDHTIQNEFNRDYKMTIRFHDMLSFIRAEHVHHPWAHVVAPEQIKFRVGGKVRVTGGSFEGVEGQIARIYGQTRVVVSIKGIINYATAYVSKKYLQPIDDKDSQNPKLEAGNSTHNRVQRKEVKMGGYVPDDEKTTRRPRIHK